MIKMWALLSVVLSIFAVFHLYVLIRVKQGFYFYGFPYWFFLVVLAFLMFCPINAHILESRDYIISAKLLFWIGNVWTGLLLVYVGLSLPLDIYHIFMSLMQRMSDGDLTVMMLSKTQRAVAPAFIAAGIIIYGAIEAHQIRIETIFIKSPKIPAGAGRLRIVQISDLHIGPMMHAARLTPIIDKVKAARPDIVVSTGDLIDGSVSNGTTITHLLSSIWAPLGKYAVSGNHENITGLKKSVDFIQKSGFIYLGNRSVNPKKFITIAGVNDRSEPNFDEKAESDLILKQPKSNFIILLKHRPEINRRTKGHFDLQLSGHTHHGQMMPFGLLIKLFYPVMGGLHQITPGCNLYVSRGTGTWGPPFRIMAPPEITVIDLLPG
ncbi:MAG: metallophosphoesterase [Desulfobacteraceae bacterium]|nr:metallophosphoesterase [Desulfobacteraceae bacterium]